MPPRIVDVHIHPLLNFVTEDELLRELEEAEIDVGILLALDLDPERLDEPEFQQKILQRLTNLHVWDVKVVERIRNFLQRVKTENSLVAELVKKHPNQFVGFGSVNLAKSKKYVEKKLNEIKSLELRGLKLIPTLQFFNPMKNMKKMRTVFKFCERNELIVTFHTGCDPYVWEIPEFSEDANPNQFRAIINEFEEVPVILAHMGCYSMRYPGIWFDEALELGKMFENVWFDISAVTYVVTRENFIDKIRKEVGLDRILFGSDYPAVMGGDIKSMVTEVEQSQHLSAEEKRKILSINARRLLNL